MKSSVPPKRIVVIGTSSGGIEALRTLIGGLPAHFPASICVVLHVAAESPGVLASLLTRAGALAAVNVRGRERLETGRIYVAPPDCHLIVEPGTVRATKGPRENRFRPAIDPLFRSAAQVFGPHAIGVILTGLLGDGTAGLWAVKRPGGTAIVQDPADAVFPETGVIPVPDDVNIEVTIACHGVLLQLKEAGRIRFRCHTGHAYSVESLLTAIDEAIEESLWNAFRSVEEGRLLLQQIVDHVAVAGHKADTTPLQERLEQTRLQGEAVRNLIRERESLAGKP
jgi:two-component system chemotaxis response regulator CheB